MVTATMRRRLGDRGVLRRPGLWLLGAAVALTAWIALVAPGADASAGWSRTVAVECGPPTEFYGPDAGDGFDAHGAVWVRCEPHGVAVAS
jgi:hypothetical protein